jgi:hypothetical protein
MCWGLGAEGIGGGCSWQVHRHEHKGKPPLPQEEAEGPERKDGGSNRVTRLGRGGAGGEYFSRDLYFPANIEPLNHYTNQAGRG